MASFMVRPKYISDNLLFCSGKEGGRMSLDEIIKMYEESTATIFPSKSRSVRGWWPEKLSFFKMP